MATLRPNLPHEDRTVQEPRQNEIHPVVLSEMEQVNHDIKLYKLSILNKEKGVKFHPGQWLDVLIPTLPKAGGFTLTSTPALAQLSPTNQTPYLELAVQKSENPPAKWLWQPPSQILNTEIRVRVGGSFIWPPVDIEEKEIEKVVFVAGGVGINPLISMLSHITTTTTPPTTIPPITFLYSVKHPPSTPLSKILFHTRLHKIISNHPSLINLHLFITGPPPPPSTPSAPSIQSTPSPNTSPQTIHKTRITPSSLLEALGSKDPSTLKKTTCFVCGPPQMTDEIVEFLREQGTRVYCEKWW